MNPPPRPSLIGLDGVTVEIPLKTLQQQLFSVSYLETRNVAETMFQRGVEATIRWLIEGGETPVQHLLSTRATITFDNAR